jgi:hypothetical protein
MGWRIEEGGDRIVAWGGQNRAIGTQYWHFGYACQGRELPGMAGHQYLGDLGVYTEYV